MAACVFVGSQAACAPKGAVDLDSESAGRAAASPGKLHKDLQSLDSTTRCIHVM